MNKFDGLKARKSIPKTIAKKKKQFLKKFKFPSFPKFKKPSFSLPGLSNLKKINFSLPQGKLSIRKQTFFAKRLSFLIKAGVPMLESICVIKEQTKSRGEISIWGKVISDVSNGQTLSASLGKFKGVFGNFAINIIKAGESSGTLIDNLNYLADELKKKDLLRKKILGAMLYPIIVTIATFGIAGLLIVYIFPKILPIFQSLKASLPLSTRMIIWISDMLRNYGFYIFLFILVSSVIAFILIKKNTKVRYVFHGLILKIPIFGSIVENYNLTNITRTMGLLLKSGSSLTETLLITAETTENLRYRDALENISKGILQGKNLSSLIQRFPKLFPEILIHMVGVGEKSGNLSTTFIYLSEYYENEFDDLTKNLSSTIEPALMIVMGIIVGFVAISVITPIYEITNSLKAR